MQKILIVEDDKRIARIIKLQLEHEGYQTVNAYSGREAVQCFSDHPDFNLVLLDIMLPGFSGHEVLKQIKGKSEQTPVIFVTAKDSISDVVFGLDLGSDDYITKPFKSEELLARVKANLRKHAVAKRDTAKIVFKDIEINLETFSVKRADNEIDLSRTEFDLFHYLVLNHDLVQSRAQILDKVWGYDYEGGENIVDVYIKYLRDKIDRTYEETLIHTVRGRGYVIR